MAKEVSAGQVSILPPTHDIKDGPTRAFLDALSNVLDARSGYTNKNAPERFVTAAEFQGLTSRAIIKAFGGGGPGGFLGDGGSSDDVPSALDVNNAIDNLAEFVTKTIIYQLLGEQFGLIDLAELRERIDAAQAGIRRIDTTRTEGDMALASAINTIWAAIGGSEAVIQDGALASATPNTAEATAWTQVQSAVRDPNTGETSSSSILQETRTYASNADGKFNSIYSVRAQVSVGGQTVVGGFGLSATSGAASGSGPTIDFGVRADKFFIAATSDTPSAATQISQGSQIPFMVLTSSQVVNGVAYPPGVYIKKAVIGDATIGTAQIAEAAITNAKIGNEISSTGYVADTTGWIIRKDGYAEFNDVKIRRTTRIAFGTVAMSVYVLGERLVDGVKGPVMEKFPAGSIIQGEPFFIDTGFSDTSAITDIQSAGFYGRVRSTSNSWIVGSSGSGTIYELGFNVAVSPSSSWTIVGTPGTPTYALQLVIIPVVKVVQPFSKITINDFEWALFRQR